jgi:hypothetical protein
MESSSAVLLIDREMLWRKLFAFDQDLQGAVGLSTGGRSHGAPMANDADAMRRSVQRVVASNRHGPLRVMLEQRLKYWIRTDIAPLFWRFFEQAGALIRAARTSKKRRHALTYFCAEQLTIAMQFAEDAFAQCVEIASILDSAPVGDSLRNTRGLHRAEGMLDHMRVAFRSILFEQSDHRAVRLTTDLLLPMATGMHADWRTYV